MLGRDIEVTRQQMLSDGYCLSTVKNAERISAAGDYVVTDPNADTPGVQWLREHVRYCRQCWCANAYKHYLIEYVEQQHPGMVTAYHQGRLSSAILGNAFRSIRKAHPEFVDEMMAISAYNMAPPNIQAAMDFQVFSRSLIQSGHAAAPLLGLAQIVRIDVEMVFDAWNLLGSAPAYDKDKLAIDWGAGRIGLPFPIAYFSFSEGVNDHLVRHFFDNIPGAMFGPINVHGFFAVNEEGKTFMSERASSCNLDEADQAAYEVSRSQVEQRAFFWIVLLRALQDEVFVLDKRMAPTPSPRLSPWVKNPVDPSKPMGLTVAPFYAVCANPKKSFNTPTKRYGKRHINWTHRWNVTGHWRTYRDGTKVWIGMYVKGPKDKPLIPSVRVYSASNWVARSQNIAVGLYQRIVNWWRSIRRGGRQ